MRTYSWSTFNGLLWAANDSMLMQLIKEMQHRGLDIEDHDQSAIYVGAIISKH